MITDGAPRVRLLGFEMRFYCLECNEECLPIPDDEESNDIWMDLMRAVNNSKVEHRKGGCERETQPDSDD